MKILLSSFSYLPSVGGTETTSYLHAREFVKLGHQVKVVTHTLCRNEAVVDDIEVIRRPSAPDLMALVAWSDIYLQNSISLRFAWPLLLVRRPWVVIHGTRIASGHGATGWARAWVKQSLFRRAHNIVVSAAVGEYLPPKTHYQVLGNPFDDQLFRPLPDTKPRFDLCFVGRLVSEKGVDVLITALSKLAGENIKPTLAIIGDGPELSALESQAKRLGLDQTITFRGTLSGQDLVEAYNQCKLLIMPSRNETFGIAAIEAMACGCAVIAARSGGLPETVGTNGILFEPDNAEQLASAISALLSEPAHLERLRSGAVVHASQYAAPAVAIKYIEALESITAPHP